jgi:hypothetical protein
MGPERYEATGDEKRLVADIAASLETAMSAEPSADFLARVRGRVDEERDRAATRWPASLSGAAASVAIVLAVIGAVILGRVLRRGPDSGPAPIMPGSPVAAAEAPSSGRAVGSIPSKPAASTRPPPTARVVGERSGSKPLPGTGVLVDPGQREALAHLAERGFAEPAPSTFLIEAFETTAPLPEMRPADLPRFEPKRLEMKMRGGKDPRWGDREWKAGGAASDSGEGSDS